MIAASSELPPVRSRINPDGGFHLLDTGAQSNIIDPDSTVSLRLQEEGVRFAIGARLVGRLEGVARARFQLARMTDGPGDVRTQVSQSPDTRRAIAQSVLASSAVEGEGLFAAEVPLFLEATTQSAEGVVTQDLSQRVRAQKAIYDAYVWALTLDRRTYIDFDLVLELHARMFVSSKATIAGRLKDKEVSIIGGGYEVRTLPADKTPVFLRELCARTNERLVAAKAFADESMLLIIAEFVLDLLAIHPFIDGNGRLARLLSTYLLERAGYRFARFYPLDLVILETRDQYYSALFKSQVSWYERNEDLTAWVDYYVKSIFTQCQRAFQEIGDRADHRRVTS